MRRVSPNRGGPSGCRKSLPRLKTILHRSISLCWPPLTFCCRCFVRKGIPWSTLREGPPINSWRLMAIMKFGLSLWMLSPMSDDLWHLYQLFARYSRGTDLEEVKDAQLKIYMLSSSEFFNFHSFGTWIFTKDASFTSKPICGCAKYRNWSVPGARSSLLPHKTWEHSASAPDQIFSAPSRSSRNISIW